MENKKELQIPVSYRPFLKILAVYKASNFRTTDSRLLTQNIAKVICVSIMLIFFVCLYLTYELSLCIREKFNLNVISQPLSFFLGSTQVFIVYIVLAFKVHEITGTIDGINQIIRARKYLLEH